MSSEPLIAVVTGASTGLGLETARQLAAKGLHVILTARSREKAEKGLDALGRAGNAEGEVLDVAYQTSVDAFFDRLMQVHGRIDVLVNNAGIDKGGWDDPLATPVEEIIDSIDNNAMSAWRMIQKSLPLMNRNGYGRVVNVSSGMGALNGMNSGVVPYRFSKTAMNAVTRIGSNHTEGDVKINSVCPGWVRTAMGGSNASLSVEAGASGIVWAATLPADGPNGGFFRHGKPIDW